MRGNHDRNLHGSRDFYFLTKYIIHKITPKLVQKSQDIAQLLCDITIQGIGRNFHGAKDSYTNFMEIFKDNM